MSVFVPAVFSSLSLGLLPERSATLMVYEDIVQIVSGFQGMFKILKRMTVTPEPLLRPFSQMVKAAVLSTARVQYLLFSL